MKMKKASRAAQKPGVEEQRQNNEKKVGGVTGKGFLPGQSGNPGGRPKGSVKLSTALQRALALPLPDHSGRTYAEAIAEKLCKEAADGNVAAAKEIADRTEGRSKQTVTFTVNQGEVAKYEAAIDHLMQAAEIKHRPITREKAIEILALRDRRILEVMGLSDGKTHAC